MIPGFLQVLIPNWLRAGGAVAIFVIVYFYNPAGLLVNPVKFTNQISRKDTDLVGEEPASSQDEEKDVKRVLSDVHLIQNGKLNLSTPDVTEVHGIQLIEDGLADDLLKFYLAAETGMRVEVQSIRIELLRVISCPLRDECVDFHAPVLETSFIIPLSDQFSSYELTPPQSKRESTWLLQGPEIQNFSVQLVYPDYKLCLFKIVVVMRDIATSKTSRIESGMYGGLRTPNGNEGGCWNFEQWIPTSQPKAPRSVVFSDGISKSAYSILISRPSSLSDLMKKEKHFATKYKEGA